MKRIITAVIMAILPACSVLASSPAAWTKLDRQSATSCIAKSGLRQARVGPVIRFSDQVMIDARTVDGKYPQPHMRGKSAKMLCLYNRRTQRAEVQEFQ